MGRQGCVHQQIVVERPECYSQLTGRKLLCRLIGYYAYQQFKIVGYAILYHAT